ncbi:MAG: hypothetical protein NVS4B4_11220 [Bradyrhizobium sp.]
MILKTVFAATVCSVLLASSGLSRAEEYRPGEYLGLDLSRALFSPKPLGPPAEFAPVPLQAMTDRGSEAAQASVEPKTPPKAATPRTRIAHRGAGARAGIEPKARPNIATRTTRPAQRSAAASLAPRAEAKLASRKTGMARITGVKPRSAVRTRIARSRGNPLDAQAFDTRIQVWPCKSGGICNWKR